MLAGQEGHGWRGISNGSLAWWAGEVIWCGVVVQKDPECFFIDHIRSDSEPVPRTKPFMEISDRTIAFPFMGNSTFETRLARPSTQPDSSTHPWT